MISKHTCFVCIGSNHNADTSLMNARQTMEAALGEIEWAEPTISAAIGHPDWQAFTNQCGVFKTPVPLNLLQMQMKGLEEMCGRYSEEKTEGIIFIDIDIISYDNQIVKPQDISRDYIISGAKALNIELS